MSTGGVMYASHKPIITQITPIEKGGERGRDQESKNQKALMLKPRKRKRKKKKIKPSYSALTSVTVGYSGC